ncbi:flavodoxin family protein [Anaerocolumna sp. MB42-C2]|uniref:flavodoxin family protein n=1 Tax=Anaerocolumna sp. MB42-C2 TaxID=3070997 RepID=UPI0027DF64B8|nr:flavodoxin family protein [Anaerocolumna sp. MB42-C2]WMJ88155.1 flavodoxin family protein [Anaerocolumna sp. MB42-C2]
MKLVIHDLESQDFEKFFPNISNEVTVISPNAPIHNCIGCFGCWVKTPGACIIRDSYGDMGVLLSKSEEVIIISKCRYGCYSPFIKNILDRSISYIHPYFTLRNNEMHHKSRYNNRLNLTVYFYGPDITSSEQKTAEKLVTGNGINLNTHKSTVRFFKKLDEMEGIKL